MARELIPNYVVVPDTNIFLDFYEVYGRGKYTDAVTDFFKDGRWLFHAIHMVGIECTRIILGEDKGNKVRSRPQSKSSLQLETIVQRNKEYKHKKLDHTLEKKWRTKVDSMFDEINNSTDSTMKKLRIRWCEKKPFKKSHRPRPKGRVSIDPMDLEILENATYLADLYYPRIVLLTADHDFIVFVNQILEHLGVLVVSIYWYRDNRHSDDPILDLLKMSPAQRLDAYNIL